MEWREFPCPCTDAITPSHFSTNCKRCPINLNYWSVRPRLASCSYFFQLQKCSEPSTLIFGPESLRVSMTTPKTIVEYLCLVFKKLLTSYHYCVCSYFFYHHFVVMGVFDFLLDLCTYKNLCIHAKLTTLFSDYDNKHFPFAPTMISIFFMISFLISHYYTTWMVDVVRTI